jgi:hypothetical protein
MKMLPALTNVETMIKAAQLSQTVKILQQLNASMTFREHAEDLGFCARGDVWEDVVNSVQSKMRLVITAARATIDLTDDDDDTADQAFMACIRQYNGEPLINGHSHRVSVMIRSKEMLKEAAFKANEKRQRNAA